MSNSGIGTPPQENIPTQDEPQQLSDSSNLPGVFDSYANTPSHADASKRKQPQPSAGYGSFSLTTSTRPPAAPPEAFPQKPKKPNIARRTTSSYLPHRGQEFSVDDAQEEVDKDLAQRQKQAKSATGSLKRQASTLRRRPTAQNPSVSPLIDAAGDQTGNQEQREDTDVDYQQADSSGEATSLDVEDSEPHGDDADLSDAESFTLKDRQKAINETHPFGIRIWKPALYKKSRSVQRNAEGDIHSTPGLFVSNWLVLFNFAWSLLFGWWLALLAALGGLVCLMFGFGDGALEYGRVLWGLAGYLLYPFGKYVKLMQDEAYAEEDEGEGRSISEYEQWQNGDLEEGRLFFGPLNASRSLIGRRRNSVDSADETQSLLGRSPRGELRPQQIARSKRRLFGRGKWNVGRVIFFLVFYGLLTPALFLVSGICWLLVFTIPMGRVTLLLADHLRRHPLALSFHSDSADARRAGDPSSAVLLCTYRAVGLKYWKYTIDGTNIFLINLLGIVAFAIFDYWVLDVTLGLRIPLTNQGLVFTMALFSIIPLAYFIGQAVASISAQSSMGLGATINAFFSTIVEVFLYCVALKEGKARLVEGSIIGSIFAGILFLPGISMCFGALKRKTQRFNVRSAGVTSTMLLFAVIGAFGPTLFYQIYGSHELNCHACVQPSSSDLARDCRRCYFSQTPAIHDRFYEVAVRPYIWLAAVMLFLSYVIGLLFTLRTHAAVIWSSEDEKKIEKADGNHTHLGGSGIIEPPGTLSRNETSQTIGHSSSSNIRESQLYKRILGQSLKQAGLGSSVDGDPTLSHQASSDQIPVSYAASSRTHHADDRGRALMFEGLTEEQNRELFQHVAELAATAATIAARDATKAPRKASQLGSNTPALHGDWIHAQAARSIVDDTGEAVPGHDHGGGHDAPNWSRTKSAVILLTATVAYAVIAEILVNTVDAVLENIDIDEKFLGITLFALVPNTTEFLNAISFAMNGNIALSMEIGSAYALQVCLLQIPALVLYSAFQGRFITSDDMIDHTFTLIFPQWDMVTVILCVFLLSYMYGEGKSNYFKGSILILSYIVVIVGFYLSGFNDMSTMGIDRFDTLAVGGLVRGEMESMGFKTVGRTRSGRAY